MSTPTSEVPAATQQQTLPEGAVVTKQLIVQKFGGSSVSDGQ
jgi:aspartate kinase